MYNDDEMSMVSDMDTDVEKRKELIVQAKNIDSNKGWNEIYREISDLRRQWRRIESWESAYEEALNDEFEDCLDALFAKRNEFYKNVSDAKNDLIVQAKKVAESKDWKKATNEMNDLLNQWKQTGSAGKQVDDELWEEFNAIRQAFFDKKHEYWENMQSKFADAKQVKADLIEKAKALQNSTEWQKTSNEFKSLMDDWKAAGNAGRDVEDDLWNEFNTYRQTFYQARNEYYDKLHELQDQNYVAKKDLVEKAKTIVDLKDFSRENTKKMKDLSTAWKEIGSCRKEKENQIWTEFRAQMDTYFDGLREFNEQKHFQWKQKMLNARARKDELIQEQKRHIKRMQEDMANVLGERAIHELEAQILDKQEFIKELEEQLADIDRQLND